MQFSGTIEDMYHSISKSYVDWRLMSIHLTIYPKIWLLKIGYHFRIILGAYNILDTSFWRNRIWFLLESIKKRMNVARQVLSKKSWAAWEKGNYTSRVALWNNLSVTQISYTLQFVSSVTIYRHIICIVLSIIGNYFADTISM